MGRVKTIIGFWLLATALDRTRAGIGRAPIGANVTLWREMKGCCKSLRSVRMDKQTKRNCYRQCKAAIETERKFFSPTWFQCSPFLTEHLTLDCKIIIQIQCAQNFPTINKTELFSREDCDHARSILCKGRRPDLSASARNTTAVDPTNHVHVFSSHGDSEAFTPSDISANGSVVVVTSDPQTTVPVVQAAALTVEPGAYMTTITVVVSCIFVIILAGSLSFFVYVLWRRRTDSGTYLATTTTKKLPDEEIGDETFKRDSKSNSIVDKSPQESSGDSFLPLFPDTGPDNSNVTTLYVECKISGQTVETDNPLTCLTAGENGLRCRDETAGAVSINLEPEECTVVELATGGERLQEHHVGALHRPAPSITESVDQTQSLPDESALDQNSSVPVTESQFSVQEKCDSGANRNKNVEPFAKPSAVTTAHNEVKVDSERATSQENQSHVLILHHDVDWDAADALRIAEGLWRNDIPCISHQMEYFQILEGGASKWLSFSLRDCSCVLLFCTRSFSEATEGTNNSHFFVTQRLIEEAVRRLSFRYDGEGDAGLEGPRIFPIVRKANDARFIPTCMKDLEWFQIPSENQWTKLIWTLRAILPGGNGTAEIVQPLTWPGDDVQISAADSAYCSMHDR